MNATQDTLEQLIDKLGVAGTLESISAICREKAEHIRANWQDNGLARTWDADASKIERLDGKLAN